MAVTRRSFIRIAGSSAVIAAAGAGTWLGSRTPNRALAPWEDAGRAQDDPRKWALSFAILAPNPHNRQPWMVDLSTHGEATLLCDLERLLPHTDPLNRQIVIGLGCFVELACIAAAEVGQRVEVTPSPDGASAERLDRRPVARLRFIEGDKIARDPLFAQVLRRRSNKEPYDTGRPVDGATLAALLPSAMHGSALHTGADDALVGQLRELTWEAWKVETKTRRTYMESVKLMRIGRSEIEANPDGIDLGGPFLETLQALGQLDRDKLADVNSEAYRQGFVMYEELLKTAMGYAWLTTPDNTRPSQFNAGRDYLRLNLKATELGLALHPLSQPLQEFPEMAAMLCQVHERLGVGTPTRVQMLARLGYARPVGPSPRWPLQAKVMRS